MNRQVKVGVFCALSLSAVMAGAAALTQDYKLHESLDDLSKTQSDYSLQSSTEFVDIDYILEPKPWQISNLDSSEGEVYALDLSSAMEAEIITGDTVPLPVSHTQSFNVVFETDHLSSDGQYTWEGIHKDPATGKHFPVSITHGQDGTFGSIETASGTYILTTTSGKSVLYKNADLTSHSGSQNSQNLQNLTSR